MNANNIGAAVAGLGGFTWAGAHWQSRTKSTALDSRIEEQRRSEEILQKRQKEEQKLKKREGTLNRRYESTAIERIG